MKRTLQINIAANGPYDTIIVYVKPTQTSVIQIIHRNIGLKCFFQFHHYIYFCNYRYICIFHLYCTL